MVRVLHKLKLSNTSAQKQGYKMYDPRRNQDQRCIHSPRIKHAEWMLLLPRRLTKQRSHISFEETVWQEQRFAAACGSQKQILAIIMGEDICREVWLLRGKGTYHARNPLVLDWFGTVDYYPQSGKVYIGR
jgi:hypothetical protein